MITERKIRNLLNEVYKQNQCVKRMKKFNFFKITFGILSGICWVFFCTTLFVSFLEGINKSNIKLIFVFLVPAILFRIIMYFSELFSLKLEKKIINQKIKVLEKNISFYFEDIQNYFKNDQELFEHFLLLLENEEKPQKEQEEMIELLLEKEDAFYNQLNEEKIEEKKQEKLNWIKEKYKMVKFEQKNQKMENKYNL
jgi:tRNA nucleotidyltransferase/poly(A) polymerase